MSRTLAWASLLALVSVVGCGSTPGDPPMEGGGDPFGMLIRVTVTSDAAPKAPYTSLVVECQAIPGTGSGLSVISRYDLSSVSFPVSAECSTGIGGTPADTWKVTAWLDTDTSAAGLNEERSSPLLPVAGEPAAATVVDLGQCNSGCTGTATLSLAL